MQQRRLECSDFNTCTVIAQDPDLQKERFVQSHHYSKDLALYSLPASVQAKRAEMSQEAKRASGCLPQSLR